MEKSVIYKSEKKDEIEQARDFLTDKNIWCDIFAEDGTFNLFVYPEHEKDARNCIEHFSYVEPSPDESKNSKTWVEFKNSHIILFSIFLNPIIGFGMIMYNFYAAKKQKSLWITCALFLVYIGAIIAIAAGLTGKEVKLASFLLGIFTIGGMVIYTFWNSQKYDEKFVDAGYGFLLYVVSIILMFFLSGTVAGIKFF